MLATLAFVALLLVFCLIAPRRPGATLIAVVSALVTANAFADVGGTVASDAASLWHTVAVPALIAAISNPATWGVLMAAVYFVLAHFSASKAAKFRELATTAFHLVENMKAAGVLPKEADKADIALGKLTELLGQAPSDAQADAAKTLWDALHGAQKAAAPAPKGFARVDMLVTLALAALVMAGSFACAHTPKQEAYVSTVENICNSGAILAGTCAVSQDQRVARPCLYVGLGLAACGLGGAIYDELGPDGADAGEVAAEAKQLERAVGEAVDAGVVP